MTEDSRKNDGWSEIWSLADHPALSILNTVAMVDGKLVDSLQGDQDVRRWLTAAGWSGSGVGLKPSSLLESARALRETIEVLVQKRKAGKRIDPTALNHYLAEGQTYLELISSKNGGLHVERRRNASTALQVLAPLAEAAAELLAHADFDLVKRCQGEDCVLWFYDRTRSHRRRWCSMATCGNRKKVASFRERRSSVRPSK